MFMKWLSLCLLSVVFSMSSFSQTAEIDGYVVDSATGDPVISAHVYILVNGEKIGAITSLEGYYSIKLFQPGSYDVYVEHATYQDHIRKDVVVHTDEIVEVNLAMSDNALGPVVITGHKDLYNSGEATIVPTFESKQIEILPIDPVDAITIISPGVYQADDKQTPQFKGARPEGTLYMIDGMRIVNGFDLPRNSVKEMKVYSGGIPAKYGDATGGVIVITTKGYKF